jgi:hypothetical protein
MKATTFLDRSDWAVGPWDDEPDRVEWREEQFPELVLLMRRGPSGAWCGYVGVPEGHAWHGQDMYDVDAEVHGGVTYTDTCDDDPEQGICHVPALGEADHLFWVGFDCAHAWDLMPRIADHAMADDVYRTAYYVREQVRSLAQQAIQA